ncbi:Myb-like DNA-binding domain protein [Ancylostoma duodenale]|uniref:Myb-like DNA-binding domain protein n=1 Tax=Ancylostoma duodenale TaxID=51022 RepID=A0A0C2FM75_9BILA|nr:Myb-like DNA-binding domain protein [Ancylostoma duodenale]
MTSRLDPSDEGAALPSDETSTSGLGSDQISRRRLAFRPPVEQRPLSTSGTRSESTSAECSTSAGHLFKPSKPCTSSSLHEEERLPRKSKTWNHDEIMVFYEGLKQCGKDFDGVMRIMAKRKVDKNKEQTKNYYFNLLKHVKQSISLDEDNQLDKFPPEIVVSLKPMTYADASYVVSCEQNPLLRIRLSTNDPISRIFQLLRHKWASLLDKMVRCQRKQKIIWSEA